MLPNSLQRTWHNFKKHLYLIESLIKQFDTRFSNFVMLRKDLIIFEKYVKYVNYVKCYFNNCIITIHYIRIVNLNIFM